MKEIFRPSMVENYLISNKGRVYSLNTMKIINPEYEEKGYQRLSINLNGVRKHYAIHRLVALAFIPNPDNKPQVDHINGNKDDNRVENLRWCNNLENARWRRNRLGR